MKTSLIALSVLTLALATACDRRDDPENAPTPEASTADTAPLPATEPTAPVDPDAMIPAPPAADDALALGLLAAVNDHEIRAAQQALAKKVSAPVADYARMMEKEHTDNLVATKALGALADTDEVKSMKENATAELAALGKKSGRDYETAYIDSMVKGHTDALALIDGRLLALGSLGPVRDHLTSTRGHVARHLAAAQQLQATP